MSSSSCAPLASMKSTFPDWTLLPAELLTLVAEKLDHSLDYDTFRMVCHTWYSLVPKINFPPLLLLPFEPETVFLLFYDLWHDKILRVSIPDASHKLIVGCSHGWLILLDRFGSMSLLNPFSQSMLQLPNATDGLVAASPLKVQFENEENCISNVLNPQSSIHDQDWRWFIEDATLSKAPNAGGDCIVVLTLTFSNTLAYCKVGGNSWNSVSDSTPGLAKTLGFYKEKFYIVDTDHNIAICDAGSPLGATLFESLKLPDHILVANFVEWKDNLLLVGTTASVDKDDRNLSNDDDKESFIIYKLNLVDGPTWSKIESIGDNTLFMSLQFNSCFIGSNISGCKKGSIYYSDHNPFFIPNLPKAEPHLCAGHGRRSLPTDTLPL